MIESMQILGIIIIDVLVFLTIGFFTGKYLENRAERKRVQKHDILKNALAKMLSNVVHGVKPNSYLWKIQEMDSYSITEECPHTIAKTKVIESVATCETTAEFCIECGEQLTQPKTEC
jgi:uncharacterized protein YneF (UPF0154 family)